MSLAQVPDSPAEPPHAVSGETDESQTKTMLLGNDAEALVAPHVSVTELLAQIAVAPDNAQGLFAGQQQMPPTADPAAAAATMQQFGININVQNLASLLNQPGLASLAQTLAGAGGAGASAGPGPGPGGGRIDKELASAGIGVGSSSSSSSSVGPSGSGSGPAAGAHSNATPPQRMTNVLALVERFTSSPQHIHAGANPPPGLPPEIR